MAGVWQSQSGDAGAVPVLLLPHRVRLGFNISVSKGALQSSEVSKASEFDPGND